MLNFKLIKLLSANLKEKGVNLTSEQFIVMDILWRNGKMPQSSIAAQMHKDKNSITQFIDSLERKKLVRRCERPTDHRINDIEVTAQGEALHKTTIEVATETMQSIFNGLSDDELDTFERLLQVVNANIDEINSR